MALQTCPDCQHKVSESALACPQCGRPLVLGAEFCPYCEQSSAKKVQGVFGSEFVITIRGSADSRHANRRI
jgi:predicted amidophosphoribosyltransferase